MFCVDVVNAGAASEVFGRGACRLVFPSVPSGVPSVPFGVPSASFLLAAVEWRWWCCGLFGSPLLEAQVLVFYA